MGAEPRQLHVAFFPLMAPGHTIPIIDIIRLFSSRRVKTTILTTPLNAPGIAKSLSNGTLIEVVPFPSQESGLTQGVENLDQCTTPEMSTQFMKALAIFQGPLDNFLDKTRPDCLVADMFFPFATEIAAKFGIPRLVFHGCSFFAMCAGEVLQKYEPQKLVLSDDEPFILPHLPHEIKLTKSQLFKNITENNVDSEFFMKLFAAAHEAELKSFGVIFNSFYELEPEYADYFRIVMGRRAWHIGPVSLCNQNIEEKSVRGKETSISDSEWLKWLDEEVDNSVIYICFGSLSYFLPSQLEEIAIGLEASGLQFIWVVRNAEGENSELKWLPDGFEERTQGKGLIIKGWAPQMLILEHKAIGGFMTHCGWNSTLEGISAGVPMVTWPLFAEQFYNEKLVTDVLKIGVPVGSKVYFPVMQGTIIKHEDIEVAMKRVMGGDEAVEMRSGAKKLKEMARKAVEEGGSSFSDLTALLQELK